MKKVLVLVTVLAFVPANAYGVSLALTSGDSSSISIDTNTTGNITVDFDLATDTSVDGYATKLKASVAGVLTGTARTLNSPLNSPNTADGSLLPLAVGTAYSASDVGAAWNEVDTVDADATVASWTFSYDTSGLAVGSTVVLAAGLQGFIPPTTTYDIPGGRWSYDGASSEMDGGTPLTINITPEPMSAMLLLAAVPFLRRRRTV